MTSIVLADDHQMVRTGFKMILEKDGHASVVGEAADGSEAYAQVAAQKPDLLIMDLSMPEGQSGLSCIEPVSKDFPQTRVMVLTMFAEVEYLYYALQHGAKGYVLKTATADQLLEAVETVMHGGIYVYPTMVEDFQRFVSENGMSELAGLQKLTAREVEITTLIAKGFTNKEIGERMFLSIKTVEAYRSKVYRKLGISTRAELVDFAIRAKLLNL